MRAQGYIPNVTPIILHKCQYETFLVITTNTTAAALLNAQPSRKYGLHDLPPSTERIGTAIVVMRE
jgi:hypothetical protein